MNSNVRTLPCDADRLESFLNGDLNESQEREFTLHLNTCENCRSALEQFAAEPDAWNEAGVFLKASGFDPVEGDADSSVDEVAGRLPLLIQNVLDALSPTDDPEMLGRLGGYEVSGVVGAGGMGVVLKAVDQSLDRTVAIKVLAPHLATSAAARKRFAREAKAAAAVLHPNVIAIHSVSNDEALPYLVMPYVRGTSLQKRLEEEGLLPLTEVLRIGAQVAAGLAAAHAQGLVHRDIKPANILLEQGVERVAITDFGLARAVDDATITHSGVIAGTPQYMSPEQARGEPVDGRSDLFSLGCVLYEMATGVSPFRADSMMATLRRLVDDKPQSLASRNPALPCWFVSVVDRLLEKDPARRFGSAKEVNGLLEGCLAHVQQPATSPLPAGLPAVRPARRRIIAWGIKVALGLVATVGIVLAGAAFSAAPPDISGKWTGEDWGNVELKAIGRGEYEGTYTETVGKSPGTLTLKWNRIERRFKGTWREGADERLGTISVRLSGGEIRGAFTTSGDSKVNPATPELGDLVWTRAATSVADKGNELKFGPVIQQTLFHGSLIDLDSDQKVKQSEWQPKTQPPVSTLLEQDFGWAKKHGADAVADLSLQSRGLIRVEGTFFVRLEEKAWESLTPDEVRRLVETAKPEVKDGTASAIFLTTYAFKTREGGIGLLKCSGASFGPDSPRGKFVVSYKLLNLPPSLLSQTKETVNIWRFGPVIERTLPNGKYFDLEKNQEYTAPEKKEADWIEKNGVDFLGDANPEFPGIHLLGRHAVAEVVESTTWESMTPAELRQKIAPLTVDVAEANLKRRILISEGEELPLTFVIRTNEGGMGLLQVTGQTDNGTAMKIRYKLLERSSQPLTGIPVKVIREDVFGPPGPPTPRTMQIEIGATLLRGGDEIQIADIRGTAGTIKVGQTYELDIFYRLASRERAILAVSVTNETASAEARAAETIPPLKTQQVEVKKGEGKVRLILPVTYAGKPHVSFYSEKGEGFGHVYFGTGDTVLKRGWWERKVGDSAKLETLKPVDLSATYQQKLEVFPENRTDRWGVVPRGEQTFGGIPFNIDGRICLWGKKNAEQQQVFPEKVAGPAVNRKFQSLYVYHATFFVSPEGAPVYELTFQYADGTSATSVIKYGVHIRDWYQTTVAPTEAVSDPKSRMVWQGDHPSRANSLLRFYVSSIENPKPGVEVKSISLASAKGDSAACILAMTTGPADLLQVEGGDIHSQEGWGEVGTAGLRMRLVVQSYRRQEKVNESFVSYRMQTADPNKTAKLLDELFNVSRVQASPTSGPPILNVLVVGNQTQVVLPAGHSRVLKTRDSLKAADGFSDKVIEFDSLYWSHEEDRKRKLTADDEKVFQALDALSAVEFVETQLSDGLKFLGEQHGINLELDKVGFAKVGVALDTPVTLKLDKVKLQAVLEKMLKDHKLAFRVKEGKLLITNRPGENSKPNEVQITGVAPGRTRIVLTENTGATHEIDVIVAGMVSSARGTIPMQFHVDRTSKFLEIRGEPSRVDLALQVLEMIDSPPRSVPRKVLQTNPKDLQAIVEVWNTSDKLVTLAETRHVDGRNRPVDEWLMGLRIADKVKYWAPGTSIYERSDDGGVYWYSLDDFSGNGRAIAPGRQSRFKVRLQHLVEPKGRKFESLSGASELRPILQFPVPENSKDGMWRGKVRGGPVSVEFEVPDIKAAARDGKRGYRITQARATKEDIARIEAYLANLAEVPQAKDDETELYEQVRGKPGTTRLRSDVVLMTLLFPESSKMDPIPLCQIHHQPGRNRFYFQWSVSFNRQHHSFTLLHGPFKGDPAEEFGITFPEPKEVPIEAAQQDADPPPYKSAPSGDHDKQGEQSDKEGRKGAAKQSRAIPGWGEVGTDGLRIRLVFDEVNRLDRFDPTAKYVMRQLRRGDAGNAANMLADLYGVSRTGGAIQYATSKASRSLVFAQQQEYLLPVAEIRTLKTRTPIKTFHSFDDRLVRVEPVLGGNGRFSLETSEEERRIEKNLGRHVSLHFENAPLKEVINELSAKGDINIVADFEGLTDAGVDLKSPVSIDVDGIRIRSALALILDPLRLTFAVRNEVLTFSSPKRLLGKTNELRIMGMSPGRTRLTLEEEDGQKRQIDVEVTEPTPPSGDHPESQIRIVPDAHSNLIFVFGSQKHLELAFFALNQFEKSAPVAGGGARADVGGIMRRPDEVVRVGPDTVQAVLEVWNTGDQAVRLAERPNVSGQSYPSDEWLIGLELELNAKETLSHQFGRADNSTNAWSNVDQFTGNSRALQPGEKARFKIRLQGLVDRHGLSLAKFRGRFELVPVLSLKLSEKKSGSVWQGRVTGSPVPIELGLESEPRGQSPADAGIPPAPPGPPRHKGPAAKPKPDTRLLEPYVPAGGIDPQPGYQPPQRLLPKSGREQSDTRGNQDARSLTAELAKAFEPFECAFVDEKTGESIAGNEFAIHVRFVIPRSATRPGELVEQMLFGPEHAGKFKLTVPEKVLKHADRDMIRMGWRVIHPRYDVRGNPETVRVNEILYDDPRTAREGLRRIKLHKANIYRHERSKVARPLFVTSHERRSYFSR